MPERISKAPVVEQPRPRVQKKRVPMPPTSHQLAEAIYRFCDEMKLSGADANALYEYATGSIVNAWSTIAFAKAAVRTFQGHQRNQRRPDLHPYLEEFETFLQEQRRADLNEVKTNPKASKEEILLHGLAQGERLRLGPNATQVVIDWIVPTFGAVERSDFYKIDLPKIVAGNVGLAIWMGESFFKGGDLKKFQKELEAARQQDGSNTGSENEDEDIDSDNLAAAAS
jgi:hypothetical protein